MAALTHNLYGELEQKLGKTITQRFPSLTIANGVDVPTTADLEEGADTVSVDVVTGYGQAGLLGAESSEIPLVQVNVTKDQAPIVMAVAGYAVSFKTERAYSFSGKSAMVTDKSVLFTRRAIDERLNTFGAYGDAGLGVKGLYNFTGVTPTNSTFDPNTATYTQWIDFLMGLVLDAGINTFDTTIPTDILISRRMMKRAAAVTNAQEASKNVLQAIADRLAAMDGYENVKVRSRPESDAATLLARGVRADNTRDRVVVYRKDPMSIGRQVESDLAQMMPEKYVFADPKAGMVYPMFSCATATQLYESNSVSYVDVLAAS